MLPSFALVVLSWKSQQDCLARNNILIKRVFSWLKVYEVLAARMRKLITARARKNKRTARILANARKDHSIPLNGVGRDPVHGWDRSTWGWKRRLERTKGRGYMPCKQNREDTGWWNTGMRRNKFWGSASMTNNGSHRDYAHTKPPRHTWPHARKIETCKHRLLPTRHKSNERNRPLTGNTMAKTFNTE